MPKGERLNTNLVKERIKNTHGENYLLLNEYGSNGNKLLIKHLDCGKTYETVYGNIVTRKRRCPHCFYGRKKKLKTYEEALNDINKVNGYHLLTKKKDFKGTQNTVEIYHDECKTSFKTKFNNFVTNKHRCKKCYHKRRSDYKTNREYQNLIDEKYGKNVYTLMENLEEENYKTKKLNMKHEKCGNIWKIDRLHFLDRSNRCPKCFKIAVNFSKGNLNIQKYFNNRNINFETEYILLLNEKTNRNLVADFYIPSLNLIIEYDGKQHFEPMFNDEEKFKKQLERDKIKNNFLKNSNYNWIRISYKNDTYEKIEKILNEKIETISSEASIN